DWGAPKSVTHLEWLALSLDVTTLNACVRYKRCYRAVGRFGQCSHAEKHLAVFVNKDVKGYEREIKLAAQTVMGVSGGALVVEFVLVGRSGAEIIRCRLPKRDLALLA